MLPTVHLTHRTVSDRHEKDDIDGDAIFQTVILNKEIHARVHCGEQNQQNQNHKIHCLELFSNKSLSQKQKSKSLNIPLVTFLYCEN